MQFDGVGFNDDIPKRMSKETFMKHEMHANHYKHLKSGDKEKALGNAYDLMEKELKSKEPKQKSKKKEEDKPAEQTD